MTTIDEINKMLADKNIDPKLKKQLEKKKQILTDNKTVEK